MFIQTRAVYIVGSDAGNPNLIHENLRRLKCLNLFFEKTYSLSSDIHYYKFLNNLPPETVFSIKIYFNKNHTTDKKYFISIPFMSSHISLPLKVGEIIWVYPFNPSLGDAVQNVLDVNSYHISRVHSMLSTEDVSFCYADRDYSILNPYNVDVTNLSYDGLNSRQKIEYSSVIQDSIKSMLDPEIDRFSDETRFIQNGYFNNEIISSNFRSIPRLYKNNTDTVLQGSHNALISLTSSKLKYLSKDNDYSTGKIKLSVGVNQNIFRFLLASNQNISVVDSNYIKKTNETILRIYEYDNKKLIQVFNGLHFETLKSLSHFSNIDLTLPEYSDTLFTTSFESTYDSDLTSVIISEKSTDFIDINSQNEISLLDADDIMELQKSKNIKTKEGEEDEEENLFYINKLVEDNLSHKRSKLVQLEDNSSFVAISDNITLSLHKSSPGHLNLIQPNSLDDNPTQIKLTDKGNILLDGNKILIGDYNRLPNKKSGGEALVFLGHSEDSQSLVLGEQLKEFMLELLDVQRQSMEDIKKLFEKSAETKKNMHQNINDALKRSLVNSSGQYIGLVGATFGTIQSTLTTGAPIPDAVINTNVVVPLLNLFTSLGPILFSIMQVELGALLAQNNAEITTFKQDIANKLLKRNEELSQRLETIEKNINEILSKFSKTS